MKKPRGTCPVKYSVCEGCNLVVTYSRRTNSKSFIDKPPRQRKPRWCSDCMHNSIRLRKVFGESRVCERCNAAFEAKVANQKYCSIECERRSRNRTCSDCGEEIAYSALRCRACAANHKEIPSVRAYCHSCHNWIKAKNLKSLSKKILIDSHEDGSLDGFCYRCIKKMPVLQVCRHCKEWFAKKKITHCCDKCRSWIPRPKKLVVCSECNKEFETNRKSQKCCSVKCGKRRYRRNNPSNWRQKAKKFGVPYEIVNKLTVFERDGWRCQMCRRRVQNKRGKHLKSNAAQVDHVIPWRKMAEFETGHVLENLQTLCRDCNWSKSDKVQTMF